MSEIFREIDEELQQDRVKELWKQYGVYAVTAILAIVIAAGGFSYWRNAETAAREAAADAFMAAQQLAQVEQYETAAQAFEELALHAPAAYSVLARFQYAAVIGEAGDRRAAGDAYREIAADPSVDTLYQELALLLMAMQTMDIEEPELLLQQLRPLAETGKPWRHTALETIAAVQIRQNDFAGAKESLTQLGDDLDAPSGARNRAVELLEVLSL